MFLYLKGKKNLHVQQEQIGTGVEWLTAVPEALGSIHSPNMGYLPISEGSPYF